jgi:hypothetical protein
MQVGDFYHDQLLTNGGVEQDFSEDEDGVSDTLTKDSAACPSVSALRKAMPVRK